MLRHSLLLLCFMMSATQGANLDVVTENWPPFNYLDNKGKIVGDATSNVEQVLALTGIDYSIELYPWSRSYRIAQSRSNVLIYSIFKTQQRSPLFHWFCPIIQSNAARIYLYKLKESDVSLKSLSDAKDLRVGVMRDDNSHQYLTSMGFEEKVNLDIASDEFANIRKLFAQRIDLIVQSDRAMAYRLEHLGLAMSDVTPVIELHPEDWGKQCMALSLNSDPELLKKLTVAFRRWQTSN